MVVVVKWSVFLPSTPLIRVRIPQKREAGSGLFQKNLTFYLSHRRNVCQSKRRSNAFVSFLGNVAASKDERHFATKNKSGINFFAGVRLPVTRFGEISQYLAIF